jgi:hypothetical protein
MASVVSGEGQVLGRLRVPAQLGTAEFHIRDGQLATEDGSVRRVAAWDGDIPLLPNPNRLALRGIHPNPFNPKTTIEFGVAPAGRIEAKIYDVRGRLVRALADEVLATGWYQRDWDGADNGGRSVGSGVYFLVLRGGDRVVTGKLTVVR